MISCFRYGNLKIFRQFFTNFGNKTLVQEGTLDLEEWENDILQGVSLSNQGVEVEAKVINGKMRNIITRA